jgi:N-formylglutamate deformylase
VHALQVEINRGLYLDEERVERGVRFAPIRRAIGEALRALVSLNVFDQTAPAARIAAE